MNVVNVSLGKNREKILKIPWNWKIGKTVIFQKKKKSVKKSGQTLKMNQKYFVFPMHEFQVLSRQKVCWSTNYALQRTSNWTVFMTHRFLSLFCVYQSRSSKTQTLKNPTKNGRNIRFVKIQFNLEKIPTFCVSSRKTSSFVGNNLQTKHFKYVFNGFQCLMERELEYWSKSMCTMIL